METNTDKIFDIKDTESQIEQCTTNTDVEQSINMYSHEATLNNISVTILILGILGGIICFANSFPTNIIDNVEFQPIIFSSGVVSILSSIFTYAFSQVIIQISYSLKGKKSK